MRAGRFSLLFWPHGCNACNKNSTHGKSVRDASNTIPAPQFCCLCTARNRPFGHDSAVQQSGGGSFSPLKSDISKGKKGDISESQMTFTFMKKYSGIFKTARLKKKELLKCSNIPRQQEYLLVGVLVSVETSTAAPCCHIPETIRSFEESRTFSWESSKPSGSL